MNHFSLTLIVAITHVCIYMWREWRAVLYIYVDKYLLWSPVLDISVTSKYTATAPVNNILNIPQLLSTTFINKIYQQQFSTTFFNNIASKSKCAYKKLRRTYTAISLTYIEGCTWIGTNLKLFIGVGHSVHVNS